MTGSLKKKFQNVADFSAPLLYESEKNMSIMNLQKLALEAFVKNYKYKRIPERFSKNKYKRIPERFSKKK